MITTRKFPLCAFSRYGCQRKKMTLDKCYFMPWVYHFTRWLLELCLQKAKVFMLWRENSYRNWLQDQTAFLKCTRSLATSTKIRLWGGHKQLPFEMPTKPPKLSSPVMTFFLIKVYDPFRHNLHLLWMARCDWYPHW